MNILTEGPQWVILRNFNRTWIRQLETGIELVTTNNNCSWSSHDEPYFISETSTSLSVHSRSLKKIYRVENFRANVLNCRDRFRCSTEEKRLWFRPRRTWVVPNSDLLKPRNHSPRREFPRKRKISIITIHFVMRGRSIALESLPFECRVSRQSL